MTRRTQRAPPLIGSAGLTRVTISFFPEAASVTTSSTVCPGRSVVPV
ncbi:hypothetical protein ACFY94_26010 [Streptomyces griseorubiginosus]